MIKDIEKTAEYQRQANMLRDRVAMVKKAGLTGITDAVFGPPPVKQMANESEGPDVATAKYRSRKELRLQ